MSLEQSGSNDSSEYSDDGKNKYKFSLSMIESNDTVESSNEEKEEETFLIGNVVRAPIGPRTNNSMMPSYVYGHIIDNSTGNMFVVSFLNGITQYTGSSLLEKRSKLLSDTYYNRIYRNKTVRKNQKKFYAYDIISVKIGKTEEEASGFSNGFVITKKTKEYGMIIEEVNPFIYFLILSNGHVTYAKAQDISYASENNKEIYSEQCNKLYEDYQEDYNHHSRYHIDEADSTAFKEYDQMMKNNTESSSQNSHLGSVCQDLDILPKSWTKRSLLF